MKAKCFTCERRITASRAAASDQGWVLTPIGWQCDECWSDIERLRGGNAYAELTVLPPDWLDRLYRA